MRAPLMALVLLLFPSWAMAKSRDQRCLALNIFFEARGTSIADQQAVGHVTMNRVKSPRWPKTICSVVYQPGQFSWTKDGNSDQPKNSKAYALAERVSRQILSGELSDNTNGATYFHKVSIRPSWSRRLNVTLRTKVHMYLRKS